MENSELIERGIHLARNGCFEKAIEVFEKGLCFVRQPAAISYYALCLAEVEKNYEKAISLSLLAADKEFYNPEIYLNLGKIFLLNGKKAVAVKLFYKGLKFDSTHIGLINEIRKLGVRRKPVIPFLPRHNPVNKLLGRFSYKWVARFNNQII